MSLGCLLLAKNFAHDMFSLMLSRVGLGPTSLTEKLNCSTLWPSLKVSIGQEAQGLSWAEAVPWGPTTGEGWRTARMAQNWKGQATSPCFDVPSAGLAQGWQQLSVQNASPAPLTDGGPCVRGRDAHTLLLTQSPRVLVV